MRSHNERGQAAVLTVVMMTALLGIATLVVDVGAWFRADRALQATVDAAALAGAQALPDNPGAAAALALQYANKNGGGVSAADISFETQLSGSGPDTIVVTSQRPSEGFFSKIFGIDAVQVKASAAARSGGAASARYAAPIAIDEKHELIQCILKSADPSACYGVPTELDLEKVGPGAFRLLNLDKSKGGTGPPILAQWILQGYDGYMELGWYNSDPGAKFNSSHVKEAMNIRLGSELLFPIYRSVTGGGANLQYEVVGWAGFVVTGFSAHGSKGSVQGYFKKVLWEGLQSTSGPGSAVFGVRTVELVS